MKYKFLLFSFKDNDEDEFLRTVSPTYYKLVHGNNIPTQSSWEDKIDYTKTPESYNNPVVQQQSQQSTEQPVQQSQQLPYNQTLMDKYAYNPLDDIDKSVFAMDLAQVSNLQPKSIEYKDRRPDDPRLTNEDFYPRQIPLVAGSISGRIIGSQLITGGGEANIMPMSVYFHNRSKLQDILIDAIAPKGNLKKEEYPEDKEQYKLPTMPTTAEALQPALKEGFNNFMDSWNSLASRYPNGYKMLYDKDGQGNPKYEMGRKFQLGLNNWKALADEGKGVVTKLAEIDNKLAPTSGGTSNLMILPSDRKKMNDILSESSKVLKGGTSEMDIAKELNSIRVGKNYNTMIAEAGKDVESEIQSKVIKTLTEQGIAPNPQSKEYHDLFTIEQSKYKFASTDAEAEEKAARLAKTVATDWQEGFEQDGYTPKIKKEVYETVKKGILDKFYNKEVEQKVEGAGTRPFEPTKVTVNNNPAENYNTTYPSTIFGEIENMINSPSKQVSFGSNQSMQMYMKPTGEVVIGVKTGNKWQETPVDMKNPEAFLKVYASKLTGHYPDEKSRDLFMGMLSAGKFQSTVDALSQQFAKFKPAQKGNTLYQSVKNLADSGYGINADGQHFSGAVFYKDGQGGTPNTLKGFKDNNGNTLVPYPQGGTSKSSGTSGGAVTTVDKIEKWGDGYMKKKDQYYIVYSTDGTTIAKYPAVQIENFINKMFIKGSSSYQSNNSQRVDNSQDYGKRKGIEVNLQPTGK